MNQIGIGTIQHAKKTSENGNINVEQLDVKQRISRNQHLHDTNVDNSKAKEGKLSVDIFQSTDEMTIVSPIAGVKKEDVKVSIQGDVLTIRGERRKIKEDIASMQIVNELFWGVFSRSIVLPDNIDRQGIAATCKDHLLIITIPKTADFKTRVIHLSE